MIKTNNACKKCRRAGQKLFLKGDKCLSPKCPLTRRSYPPGQHGQSKFRLTEYARQLREKQKAAQIYGISHKQFFKYYQKSQAKKGMTNLTLMRFLELRLDNIIFRLGLADSRNQAKSIIRDGHIRVNGKKISFPSYQVKVGDKIEIKDPSLKKQLFLDKKESLKKIKVSGWLKLTPDKFRGELLRLPERNEIDTSVDEHIILEYFAR